MVPVRRTQPNRVPLVVGLVCLAAGVLTSMPTSSQADTASPPTTTKASVLDGGGVPLPAQTNVLPNGPLTGLANGTTVRVNMSANTGSLFAADARLCRSGVNIGTDAAFNPADLGNCIDVPFNAQSDSLVTVEAATPTTPITLDFRVGAGTRAVVNAGPTNPRTVTCGVGSPCTLWLKEAVDSGNVFIHFDLLYGADTTSSTSTSSSSTTSSTAPQSTSSTSSTSSSSTTSSTISSSTTSTTKAGTTTSTAAGATTSSTAAGATTSTTAAGPLTVTPATVTAGGSISVTSTGWKAATQVTVVLNSTPVTLGTLTADASGRVSGSFTVPANTAAGTHTVNLSGTGAGGEARQLNASITVAASGTLIRTGTDAWRLSALAIALMLLGASILLLDAARRRSLWKA